MQYRTATNSILAIGGTYSLIGSFGTPILKLFNFVQFADWLREMMNLVQIKDVSISWPGIYLLLFISCVVGIVAINFDLAKKYYLRKKEAMIYLT